MAKFNGEVQWRSSMAKFRHLPPRIHEASGPLPPRPGCVDLTRRPNLESKYVDLLPEDPRASALRLLSCAFWRPEVARLTSCKSDEQSPPPERRGRWFFVF